MTLHPGEREIFPITLLIGMSFQVNFINYLVYVFLFLKNFSQEYSLKLNLRKIPDSMIFLEIGINLIYITEVYYEKNFR